MKFQLFKVMSREEAQEYLGSFLAFGKDRGIKLLEANLQLAVDPAFSTASLPVVLEALITNLKTVPRREDPNVPEFIRDTGVYQNGLFNFDEPSNIILLAAAYYLGETFVRNFDQLKWHTGNPDYVQGNMPVVATFKYDLEMAPTLIIENLFRRAIMDSDRLGDIKKAIDVWLGNVPN